MGAADERAGEGIGAPAGTLRAGAGGEMGSLRSGRGAFGQGILGRLGARHAAARSLAGAFYRCAMTWATLTAPIDFSEPPGCGRVGAGGETGDA